MRQPRRGRGDEVMSHVWLAIDPLSTDAAVLAAASLLGDAWLILESYTEIRFEKWAGQSLGEEFAGWIFSAAGEARWRREAGEVQGWFYHETESGQGEQYEVKKRHYLGWGEWKVGRWWEPRLTQGVQYPLEAGRGRVRFTVREYSRLKPAEWPQDLDELEADLNRPHLAAYRLLGIDVQERGD